MLKPNKVALFDVDGVCNNFTQTVLDATISMLKASPDGADHHLAEQIPGEDAIVTYRINQHIPEAAWRAACLLLAESDIWSQLPVVPEAQEAVEKLHSRGVTVIFATAPWHSCDLWTPTRYAWLRKHFNAHPDYVYIGRPKELLRGAMLIEDRAETLNKWAMTSEENRYPILIDRPWNRDAILESGVVRSTWPELLGRLDELIDSL